MGKKVEPPRGMNDVLPLVASRKESMIRRLTPIYRQWGFSPIECPAMENLDRLLGSDGGDNEKLLFQVLKRGLEEKHYQAAIDNPKSLVDLGLRYDLTVPMARFYASNQGQLPSNCKFLQFGPVWRAERPQKGRFRQFMQWDADIVGTNAGLPEIELLLCSSEALAALGLSDFTIRINDRRLLRALIESVGIETDRYAEACITIDKLDKIGLDGVKQELLSREFSSNSVENLVEKLAWFIDGNITSLDEGLQKLDLKLEPSVLEQLQLVFNQVSQNISSGKLQFDPTLVRGMGYYTGQIFEVQYGEYGFSIAGGGRYDGMIGRFLNRDIPACGFSLGFDRILTVLTEENKWPEDQQQQKLLLLTQNDTLPQALQYANTLRNKDWDVSIELKIKNVKKQIEEYKSLGYSHFSFFNVDGEQDIKPIG